MRGGLQHLRNDGEMIDMKITNMAGTAIRISLPICAIRVDSSQDCLFAQPLKISEPNLTSLCTHATQGRNKAACSKERLLRPGFASLTQLLQDACPRLNLAAEQSTLLVDDVLFKGSSTVQASIDSAGINNNSKLTVVVRQFVSLRCHYVIPSEFGGQHYREEWLKKGQHYVKHVPFEVGQRLGEPWPALPKVTVCSTGSRSLLSLSRNREWS